ncbi:MAG: QcrA and Rieske domain-containing protein [Planctomycetota bacterium]
MKIDAISLLNLAEDCERTGDAEGVSTFLELAAEANPEVKRDPRYQGLASRLATFLDRRRLLRAGAGFIAVTLASAAGFGGLLYLLPPEKRLSSDPVVKLGPEEEFLPDTFRMAEFRGHPVLVVRDAEGDFHALSAICTHSEVCLLQWEAETQEIICPCHRAAFDLRGNVIEGPPPKPLPVYEVHVLNGIVFVRLS